MVQNKIIYQGTEAEATVTLQLTDVLAPIIISGLALEIEIMQGTTTRLADGRTEYVISVAGEKAQMCRQFTIYAGFADLAWIGN